MATSLGEGKLWIKNLASHPACADGLVYIWKQESELKSSIVSEQNWFET